MMKKIIPFLLCAITAIAQPRLDSLLFSIKNLDDTTQIKQLTNLCWEYRSKNPESAIEYGLTALNMMENVSDLRYKSEALNFLGVIYGNLGNLDSAYSYYQDALEVSKAIGDSAQIAYSLNNIGDYYYKNALYSIALEKIFNAYDIFASLNHQQGMAYCLNDIGEIYLSQKDYDKALEYFERSGEIRAARDDQRGYAKFLLNIASVYAHTKKIDKSLETYNEALQLSKEIDYIKGVSWAYAGIGDIYLSQKKYKQALDKRFEALNIDIEIGNKYGEIINYNQIGFIYINQNNLTKAREYLNKARNESALTGHLDQLMVAYGHLRTLALARNDYTTAYNYLEEHSNLKDSIFSHENVNMIADLQTAFITEQKDRENERLKREIDFEKKTNSYLLIITFLVIAGILMLIAMYRAERKARVLYAELNSSKDKFFSIIAHDLKNPFGALSNIAGYLKTDYDSLTEDERRILIESISSSANQIQNLLIDLLTWARAQTGEIKINKHKLNLKELLQSTYAPFDLLAKNNNVAIKIECNDTLHIDADKFIMETVIGNLINNAIKFSEWKSEVIVAAKKNKDTCEISVTDFGKGMDEETLSNLFKLDVQQSTDTGIQKRGTGLGLNICKEFLEIHDGTIEVESEPMKGSKFTVKIPCGI